MTTVGDSLEQNELRRIARAYRRRGYRVSWPGAGSELPSFLGDVMPDLIAESDKDRAVIKVKLGGAVAGSNELIELAERVAREPGWRFELVALADVTSTSLTDGEAIDLISKRAREATESGFPDTGYVFAASLLEHLLIQTALANKVRITDTGLVSVASRLTVMGVIPDDLERELLSVADRRSRLIREATQEPLPTRAEVEAVLRLAKRVSSDLKIAA